MTRREKRKPDLLATAMQRAFDDEIIGRKRRNKNFKALVERQKQQELTPLRIVAS